MQVPACSVTPSAQHLIITTSLEGAGARLSIAHAYLLHDLSLPYMSSTVIRGAPYSQELAR